MKIFLKRRMTFVLVFLLILVALQIALVYLSLDRTRRFEEVRNEVLIMMAVFFLIQFTITVLIVAQFPYYLKKYLQTFDNIVSEISGGNYQIDIDVEEYRKLRDKEMIESIVSLKKMMDIVIRFDSLKKLKIQEQRARLIALLNLTENGFIIVNRKGDIVYINYLITEYFPTIKENMNILEANFSMEIDKNIKSYVIKVIRAKGKLVPKNFYMSTLERHIALKSEIVRDSNGDFDGTVIGIYNLDKGRKDKSVTEESTEKGGKDSTDNDAKIQSS